VIAGATAAAATSIVTAPYYAGVAAVDAAGKVVDYAKDKSRHLPGASAGPGGRPERGKRRARPHDRGRHRPSDTSSDWPTATTLGHYGTRKIAAAAALIGDGGLCSPLIVPTIRKPVAAVSPFSVATILCDVSHFFPVATRLPCGRLADNVRLTCTANSNPKENDHGSSKRQRSEHAASAAGLSAAAGTERRRQETGRRAEGVPAGAARTPVKTGQEWAGPTGVNTGLSPVLRDECEAGARAGCAFVGRVGDSRRLTGPGRRRRYQNPPFP
jgi:hypothetical protein